MESKTTKPYRHCPGEDYEISIFICRGRQRSHYPKCPTCEFRTKTDETASTSTEKVAKEPSPPRLINTGSIVVKSEPPSAEIYLDGDNIGVTPAIITQILPGRYKVKIKMDGYDAWNESVDVKSNKETSLTARLQGKDGSLVIESEPTNAKIFIDGNNVGVTPETINNVKSGKCFIEIKLDGHETWSNEINVEAEKETFFTAELTKGYGSIFLGSEPTKSKIFLDGIEIGTTPANLRSVPHGKHIIEVMKNGYNVWEKSVNIEPGKEKVFTAILQLKTGSASIKSTPKNAKIYLDGKYVGTTPERIKSIIPGTHEIKVQMDQYDIWGDTVNIEAGKENVITAVLQKSTGSLMVESDPANATIFFDGKNIGTTPEIIMSSAKGTHTVEVRMKGYDLWERKVDIEPGTEKSLTAILQLKTGSLSIKSKPSSAMIFIDGKKAGPAPKAITELLPGTHKVEVRMDGYKNWCENVEVNADKENHFTAVLQMLTGSLNIKSEPPNAIIIVNGNEVGNTPANIADLEPGKHLVEVRIEGHATWSKNVKVSADKENHITAVLRKLTGSLNIKSEPSNAIIIVNGSEVGNTPANIADLEPGKHLVEARIEGYAIWSENVEVSADKENHITAILRKLTGSLNIKSEPSNAIIIVNGNEVGNTPANIADLEPGKHLVEVRIEGYAIWSENVEVSADKENHITAILRKLTGSLNIKSEPSNAIIIVNGNEVGNTPANIADLEPGKHLVEVRIEGYAIWSENVEVSADKENHITAILRKLTGSLNIKSEPSNAIIIVNGNKVGNTPANIADLEPGKHLVEVRIEGYAIWSENVEVSADKENHITAVLRKLTGSLNIKSEPSNAIIIVNGNEVGNTPANIADLEPGKHLVEVRIEGHATWSKNVKVSADKENHITAVLRKLTGSLNIKSEPSNAIIIVNGSEVGNTPANIADLEPGMHLVEVRIEGHATWSKNVKVSADKENHITAVLRKLTGSLNIKSEPSNAMIIVNGNEVGNAPVNITDLEPGRHLVEARIEGHAIWSENVEVSADKENHITAVLRKLTGSLNIKSEPPNAMIIVNGNEVGNAPANIADLEPGKHLVEARIEGHAIWSENVEVSADKENHITAVLRKLTGSLNIKSEPSNAMIIVNGSEVGNTPANIADLEPGKHLVEVRIEGHATWSENVEVSADKENQITAVLQIIPGSFSIHSEPSSAVIFIDGREAGTTPLIITDPDHGKHFVEVKMDGYDDWKEGVNIEHNKETNLTAVLQLKAGSLCIKSKPSIAVVLIDGKEVGATPLIITDPGPGTHNVEVKMPGFEMWSKSVKIETGKEAVLTAVLQLKASPVTINSVPSDAMILINGKEIGKTPVNITDPDPGTYLVEVRMDGYETWNERVDIEPGKKLSITAELQMKTGLINVSSNPSEATIHIDGKHIGNTPDTITNLAPGMHFVEVKKEGYEIWSESVEVTGEKENRLSATLLELTGSVNIISNPTNAIIRMDGKETGNTPTIITNLSAGKHLVEISMDGYEMWSDSVNIDPEMEIAMTVELQIKTGSVFVRSEPPDAMILIDGKRAGSTPETLTDIEPGKHLVEIKMKGYIGWNESIEIDPGIGIDITAKLQTKAGSVGIKSEPSEAMILLDGEDVGKSPKIMTGIKAGRHEVEVRMDGYVSWMKMIKIKAGMEHAFTAVLQRKRGSLMIASTPSNATICIQDKKIGKTPRTIAELIPGNYTVEVKYDEYLTWSEKVEIVPDKEVILKAVLVAKPGSISIKSKPSDAKIMIDGNETGTTPETIKDLSPGTHMVDISIDGYADWNESVDVIPGKEIDITAILQMDVGITTELHVKGGRLNINSEPSNATILIDGKEEGATPKMLTDIKPGKHIVDVRMEGYAEWVKKINIKEGEEISLNAALQSITGTVSLESEPTEAMVLLDGEDVGMSPQIMTGIKAGRHEVEVRIDGYVSWVKMIKVKAGREYAFTAVLQRRRGAVMITSNPSNAMIYIQDKKIGKSPRTVTELIPGNYTVEVKHDEYLTWSEKVEIISDNETTLKAVLQTKPGSISIKSKPSDAKILIDGNEAGTTPETINDIECGTHIVELKVEEYETWSENVEVKPNKESSLTAVLMEMTGSISIKSEPPHAMIFIDGKKAGATPKVIENLARGTHKVDISMDGYSIWSESVAVEAEMEKELTAKLQEIRGTVNINSRPSGALILLDGKEAGTTPQTIKDLIDGMHLVEASMEGYEHWSENIKVIAGKEYTMTAALQEITGSIDIKSEPSNATILVNGKETGPTPETIKDLKPGMHQVEVKMDGFENWNNSVEVSAGKESKLTVTLQQLTCSVNINSEPPDAKILIDNSEKGTTPQTIKDLSTGMHEIEIRKDGYQAWNESITIGTDKKNTVTALLQRITGSINIQSDPSNAMILIDGKKAGTTPATIKDLSPGTHKVDISMDGHAEWKENIEIIYGKEIDLTATLQIEVGSIDIKSKPSDAMVLLDGKEVGTTPATLSSIPVGSHEIEIKIDGYKNCKRSIIIKKGKVNSLNTTLQLNIGSISIESYPEKAKVILDGKEIGKSPKHLTDIIVGTHEVVVSMDGYVTWKKTIKVKTAKETSLTVDLEKKSDTVETLTDSTMKSPEIPEATSHEVSESELKPEKVEEKTITPPEKREPPPTRKEAKRHPGQLVKLRSIYDKISDSQINSLPFITVREEHNSIFLCHSSIIHCYEEKPVGNGDVIIDHTTELMWYQSGSLEYFNLRKAMKWLKKANKESYAGFNNWRLPTLEEASSLLEFESKDGNFIDPVFDNKQWGTWTGNKSDRGHAWIVTFVNGTISQIPAGTPATFVRPVRSLNT